MKLEFEVNFFDDNKSKQHESYNVTVYKQISDEELENYVDVFDKYNSDSEFFDELHDDIERKLQRKGFEPSDIDVELVNAESD